MEQTLERKPVESTRIASVGHDPENNILEVEFRNGGVYRYRDFTAKHFDDFINAESLGRHLGKHIVGKFPYEKISS